LRTARAGATARYRDVVKRQTQCSLRGGGIAGVDEAPQSLQLTELDGVDGCANSSMPSGTAVVGVDRKVPRFPRARVIVA